MYFLLKIVQALYLYLSTTRQLPPVCTLIFVHWFYLHRYKICIEYRDIAKDNQDFFKFFSHFAQTYVEWRGCSVGFVSEQRDRSLAFAPQLHYIFCVHCCYFISKIIVYRSIWHFQYRYTFLKYRTPLLVSLTWRRHTYKPESEKRGSTTPHKKKSRTMLFFTELTHNTFNS